jgi:hypothetical protein
MELDFQSLFGLHVNSCTHWLRPRNSPPPRTWAHIRGRYWSDKIDDISLCDPLVIYWSRLYWYRGVTVLLPGYLEVLELSMQILLLGQLSSVRSKDTIPLLT